MPIGLLYLIILFSFVCLYFVFSKRPIYEAMLFGFILMLAITGTWGQAGGFLLDACRNSLIYAIICFMALSKLLKETGVIDACIAVILSLFGRLRGGAGYVCVIASTFMGALSGSGPGNVMATGVITIPSMKKSGFPSYLAANVSAASSTMGNMIPPSGIIVATYGCYTAFCESAGRESVNVGHFWLVLWAIAAIFIVQRLITVYILCKKYNIAPMKKNELPSLSRTFKEGRKALLLPLVILAPFIIDSVFSDFIISRLGEGGAKSFSSCVLLFIGGIAGIYSLLIAKNKKTFTPVKLAGMFSSTLLSMVPTVSTIIFAYSIGNLFDAVGISEELTLFFQNTGMSVISAALIIPLFTTFLGMIFPGSAQVAMFGSMLVAVLAHTGIDPLLAAAMLPTICGGMSGITPPVAVCTFAAMGIAGSDYAPTVKNSVIWVVIQYAISVLLLMGLIPVIGI